MIGLVTIWPWKWVEHSNLWNWFFSTPEKIEFLFLQISCRKFHAKYDDPTHVPKNYSLSNEKMLWKKNVLLQEQPSRTVFFSPEKFNQWIMAFFTHLCTLSNVVMFCTSRSSKFIFIQFFWLKTFDFGTVTVSVLFCGVNTSLFFLQFWIVNRFNMYRIGFLNSAC